MGKRNRTNMSGLVSHTCPNGSSYQGRKEQCKEKIKKLQKLINEGYKVAGVKTEKSPKAIITLVLGNKTKVSAQIFEEKYKPLGFKVIAEIY